MSADIAIAGLGMTEVGKVFGPTAPQFAAQAVRRAVADAGLILPDVDGLLVSAGATRDVTIGLAKDLGLKDLQLLAQVTAFGSTAGALVQYAAMAIRAGMAETVVCVHADAPLRDGTSAGASYGARRDLGATGYRTAVAAAGMTGANQMYAMAARRHMLTFGTTSEQFGAVAVAERAWASRSPLAQLRDPITIEDHQRSRWIAEPFHLFDCCLVSNGGVAVVVTSAARARDLARPPVYVLGWAQGHPGVQLERGSQFGLVSAASLSGPAAMKMAGITTNDVDVCELYDCYTYTVLITLEDYGFCAKGEGGEFVASGVLGPGGALPTNTGGGQLSGYYLWGATPLSEGVIQTRGDGGDRQVDRHDVVLVSGNGGILDYHSTLVLGTNPG
ncbi:MAG: thiolase family protein [Acidimicrobiales bacterium]|nr:thiolase family protein [Acidimicrobiales bacterium]